VWWTVRRQLDAVLLAYVVVAAAGGVGIGVSLVRLATDEMPIGVNRAAQQATWHLRIAVLGQLNASRTLALDPAAERRTTYDAAVQRVAEARHALDRDAPEEMSTGVAAALAAIDRWQWADVDPVVRVVPVGATGPTAVTAPAVSLSPANLLPERFDEVERALDRLDAAFTARNDRLRSEAHDVRALFSASLLLLVLSTLAVTLVARWLLRRRLAAPFAAIVGDERDGEGTGAWSNAGHPPSLHHFEPADPTGR
jgi:hypothetical protein